MEPRKEGHLRIVAIPRLVYPHECLLREIGGVVMVPYETELDVVCTLLVSINEFLIGFRITLLRFRREYTIRQTLIFFPTGDSQSGGSYYSTCLSP